MEDQPEESWYEYHTPYQDMHSSVINPKKYHQVPRPPKPKANRPSAAGQPPISIIHETPQEAEEGLQEKRVPDFPRSLYTDNHELQEQLVRLELPEDSTEYSFLFGFKHDGQEYDYPSAINNLSSAQKLSTIVDINDSDLEKIVNHNDPAEGYRFYISRDIHSFSENGLRYIFGGHQFNPDFLHSLAFHERTGINSHFQTERSNNGYYVGRVRKSHDVYLTLPLREAVSPKWREEELLERFSRIDPRSSLDLFGAAGEKTTLADIYGLAVYLQYDISSRRTVVFLKMRMGIGKLIQAIKSSFEAYHVVYGQDIREEEEEGEKGEEGEEEEELPAESTLTTVNMETLNKKEVDREGTDEISTEQEIMEPKHSDEESNDKYDRSKPNQEKTDQGETDEQNSNGEKAGGSRKSEGEGSESGDESGENDQDGSSEYYYEEESADEASRGPRRRPSYKEPHDPYFIIIIILKVWIDTFKQSTYEAVYNNTTWLDEKIQEFIKLGGSRTAYDDLNFKIHTTQRSIAQINTEISETVSIFTQLADQHKKFKLAISYGGIPESELVHQQIDRLKQQIEGLQRMFLQEQTKIETCSRWLSEAMSHRNTEAIKAATTAMSGILEQTEKLTAESRKEAKLMSQIAINTQKDGQSMKIIAILTMIFLPGSFVSSVFGWNIISFDVSDDGSQRLVISTQGLQIFFIFFFLFTFITILGCWIWVSNSQKNLTLANADIQRSDEDNKETEKKAA
ncbi:hypothetical protein TWF506_008181 [Arthrobotrys conoides]|uniref:Uncharacterized protein n=1 Tax=Arthrobotrys conoides TaxID=74498 RepID=A0AAN8NVF8_9PEZI